jgi:GMP synthase (glutamine-hydrolysing)
MATHETHPADAVPAQSRQRPSEVEAFRTAGGLQPEELKVVRPAESLVSTGLLDEIRGVIIGGGSGSVKDPDPNHEAARNFIRAARERHLPTLGICFGAQLLAHVFGGQASYDPATGERGTFDFELLDATDPLFTGLPSSFPIQCWHHARVVRLPEGAKLLGRSERCPVQAFAFPGEKIWGVQFHPERTPDVFGRLLETRLASQEMTPEDAEAIRRTLRPSPEAASLIARFVKLTE